MNNLEDLSKFVDHRPLFLGVATVLLSDNEIRLLVLKPSDNESWELPGSAAGTGEMVKGITEGEIFEDTNLEIDKGTLFDEFSGAK